MPGRDRYPRRIIWALRGSRTDPHPPPAEPPFRKERTRPAARLPVRRSRPGTEGLAPAGGRNAPRRFPLIPLATHPLAAASLDQVITNLTNWITGFLVGLATLFLTVGGARYLASDGNPSEVERAKSALKSAAVGYGLAVLAPVLVTALKSIVGG